MEVRERELNRELGTKKRGGAGNEVYFRCLPYAVYVQSSSSRCFSSDSERFCFGRLLVFQKLACLLTETFVVLCLSGLFGWRKGSFNKGMGVFLCPFLLS